MPLESSKSTSRKWEVDPVVVYRRERVVAVGGSLSVETRQQLPFVDVHIVVTVQPGRRQFDDGRRYG